MAPASDRFTAKEAARLDAADPLRQCRDAFVIDDPDVVYLDGNSLGRLPKRTAAALQRFVEDEWGRDLVRGWNRWIDMGLRVGDELAPLLGASPGEVAVCDQTSVNLYKLASAALAETGRPDIVTDVGNFPSDRYVLAAVAAAAGGNVRLIGEDPDADSVAAALDDLVGVVALSHVSYRSGAIIDMGSITRAAHSAGAFTVWDLSHSAGAIPVELASSGAELALGCTYKYLNGGPGAPAFLYVAQSLQRRLRQPIAGWFGHADQFAFAPDFVPAPDIRRFLVGTPPILSMIGAAEGIALTAGVGIAPIREKSVALSERFIAAVDAISEIASPREAERRGSHVTIRHDQGWQVSQALRERGVIVDFRAPDLVRFGFAPLYTSFDEARRAAEIVSEVLESKEFLRFPADREKVT